jgi:hypothetical protein
MVCALITESADGMLSATGRPNCRRPFTVATRCRKRLPAASWFADRTTVDRGSSVSEILISIVAEALGAALIALLVAGLKRVLGAVRA